MIQIKRILASYDKKPNIIFNSIFLLIGNVVRLTCRITPLPLLDGIAQIMEVFNIVSYHYMSIKFPEHKDKFLAMQKNEQDHEIYLSTFPKLGRQ